MIRDQVDEYVRTKIKRTTGNSWSEKVEHTLNTHDVRTEVPLHPLQT